MTTDSGSSKDLPGRTGTKLAGPYAIATLTGAIPVFFDAGLWFVPIVAMLGYLGFGLDKAKREGFQLEFADSFYYLGFTLTISSLLASLHPFESVTPNPEEVLRFFGLGLLTTLVGVIGRTVLQMYYRTTGESIEALNQRIETAAREYFDKIEQINARAGALLTSTNDRLGEALGGGSKRVADAVANLETSLTSFSDRLNNAHLDTGPIESAFTNFQDAVDEAVRRLRPGLQTLQVAAESTGRAADSASKTAGELAKGLSERMSTIDNQVAKFGETLRKLAQGVELMDGDRTKAIASLEGLSVALGSGTAQVGTAIKTLNDALRTMTSTISGFERSISGGNVEATAMRLTTSLGSLSDSLGKHRAELSEISFKGLDGGLNATLLRAQELNKVLDEIIEAIHVKLQKLA